MIGVVVVAFMIMCALCYHSVLFYEAELVVRGTTYDSGRIRGFTQARADAAACASACDALGNPDRCTTRICATASSKRKAGIGPIAGLWYVSYPSSGPNLGPRH